VISVVTHAPVSLPQSVEAVLAQIAAAQAGDPSSFSSDALTQSILSRLNEEVARVYAEASAAGEDLDAEGEGDEEEGHDEQDGRKSNEGGRVQLRKGPLPVDLWKAVHEVDRAPKEVSFCAPPASTLARASSPPSSTARRSHVGRVERFGFAPQRVQPAQAAAPAEGAAQADC
jgi:hypothetical protein